MRRGPAETPALFLFRATPAHVPPNSKARLDIAASLSLAAGYAGPLFSSRALFGPAGRRRSLEERRAVAARARQQSGR